jgi:hypothetical protein
MASPPNKEIIELLWEIREKQSEQAKDIAVIKEKLSDYQQVKSDVQELKTDYATMTVKMAGVIGGVTMVVSLFFNGLLAYFRSTPPK